MTPAARERSQVRSPILFISASAWTLLLVAPSDTALHIHHSARMQGQESISMLLTHNSLTSLATGWALMLVAMMGPLLSAPVRHIFAVSFAYRRARAIALFIVGYATVWMAAGAVLLALALAVQLVATESMARVALMMIVALAWQCSPAKQRCLNRGHAHPELAAFGSAADFAVLRFGLMHGVWCVGSCWALMLLPSVVSHEHVAAMAAVTVCLAAERLDRPMPPHWRMRGPGKAVRIALAQAHIWLRPS